MLSLKAKTIALHPTEINFDIAVFDIQCRYIKELFLAMCGPTRKEVFENSSCHFNKILVASLEL